ncbi:MAG: M14 family zinc carboxypeptidase [Candidatus Zixiibacteriota bacterium]
MIRQAILLSCLSALACVQTARAAAEPVSQIKVHQMTKAQYLDMISLGLDILEADGDQFEILAKPGDLDKLRFLGISYDVVQADMAAFYASRYEPTVDYGGFRTLSEIEAYLDTLATVYPNLCTQKFSIGTTIEGRQMWVIKVSDNPAVDENEPELFYNSLIHAREPAGAAALLTFIDYLLSNYGVDQGITDLVDNREFYFLPVTNPDGYYYNEVTDPTGGGMWRKNRRVVGGDYGIDLNRNFSAQWGFDDLGSSSLPASETYRGTGPFSEPETQNIRDFVNARQFVICHNIHTYSNLVLWPFGYDRIYTHRDDFFNNLGDSMTQFNGYTPQVSWVLYPTNGAADDWMWGDTISKPRIISLTTEIGGPSDGFWPPPSRIPVLEAENIDPQLFLARIADNPYVIAPPTEPILAVPDSSGPSYSVHWHVDDSINTPVSYRLYELTGKQTVTDDAEVDHGYWDAARMIRSTVRKHAGTWSWGSQSANRANHWLVSRTPYLVTSGDSLRFWIWYDIEQDWDYFYAQVSTDGGYQFANLANDLTTNSDPNNQNLGNGITGSSGTWVRVAYDLSAYAGQQVIIRLSYFTDSYTLGLGVWLDDIGNVDMFAGSTQIGGTIIDTSYAFTNRTPGTYWYRARATDAQGQEGRLGNLVATSVYDQLVAGDFNNDGTVDIGDLSGMVDYLFFGGIGPDPWQLGDLNCDSAVDISDLQALIDYLFFGAPLPVCP